MSLELEVMAEAFYVARFTPDWSRRPYWMLRRCVVPYVMARQFLVLQRDKLPVAFAGWALEQPATPRPWREDGYLPSAAEIAGDGTGAGSCCVTEIISPFLPPQRIVDEVARWLELGSPPPWIERDARRRVVTVHGANHGIAAT